MATPTRSQGVSTPRNPLTSTPNRPTASPRPSTGHLQNRAFAHNSPAVKTPASGSQGHSHRISISSQPTSTPMAAPAIHEELLNLNSPAVALIASIGNAALTPLPSAPDGLGIAGGIMPTSTQDVGMPRNPELERIQRLQEIARLLESRSLGRGVTRQGVAGLAQKERFDHQWDGATVNIAGNSVDLEMTFDAVEVDVVRDVTLNLVTDDAGDPLPQEAASAMLKRQLVLGDDAGGQPWRDLHEFATNLHYLGHHDHLPCPTNAFKVLGGLSDTFQKIWAEEKKRMRDRHEALHICQGNIGRPATDVGKKLGLCSQFWVKQNEFVAATADAVSTDGLTPELWSATFSLDIGQPSINSEQDWLEADILARSITTEALFQDNQAEKPIWKDTTPLGGDESAKQEDMDTMHVDGADEKLPPTLGVQFVCDFAPGVLVPINALTELNAQFQMLQVDQSKVVTLQQALQTEVDRAGVPSLASLSSTRWKKTLSSFDEKGAESRHVHAYTLFTTGGSWCFPVTTFRFVHPRQYAATLPILRQHILLWSILRTTVVDNSAHKARTPPATLVKRGPTPSTITKRSNKKVMQVELDQILANDGDASDVSNIDITLDLVSDVAQVKLDVLIPTRASNDIRVQIVVHRNGIVDVKSISGVPCESEERLKRQASRVIRLSEDIGVLACWLMKRATGIS